MVHDEQDDTSAVLGKISRQLERSEDASLANLIQNLEAERDARREERFIFILIIIILLDVVFFSVLDSWTGPLSLIVLQTILLLVLARRMGIEEFQMLIDKLVGRITEAIQNRPGSPSS